jgi:hypothetical protein
LSAFGPARPSRADDGGTTERPGLETQPGYKGLPGAKDPGEPGKSDGWIAVDLKITPETDWKFRTPLDTLVAAGGAGVKGNWISVTSGTLPLTGEKGQPIRFELRPPNIFIDAEGSGACDTVVRSELVAVKARRPDGSSAPFYFKLRRSDKSFYYTRACMAVGKFEGVEIAFIDENNNGQFGDADGDAIRVGGAPVALRESAIVSVKNKLYHVRVDQAGSKAWFKPYEGPTGRLDLASKFHAKSPLLYAMVREGECIFNAAEKDMVVPIGEWTLEEGLVGPTVFQSAKIQQGAMKPFVVKEGEATVVEWGMTGKIEFACEKQGNVVKINTGSIRILGSAGEQYVNFQPKAFTPNCQIRQVDGKVVYFGNMGAGC